MTRETHTQLTPLKALQLSHITQKLGQLLNSALAFEARERVEIVLSLCQSLRLMDIALGSAAALIHDSINEQASLGQRKTRDLLELAQRQFSRSLLIAGDSYSRTRSGRMAGHGLWVGYNLLMGKEKVSIVGGVHFEKILFACALN